MAVEENRWGILFCPKKSRKKSRKYWEKVQKILDDRHVLYDFVQSENSSSVERLVKMMINNGYKTIVIVGGDSALNDTVNCLMMTEKSVRDTISVGLIPYGIMNDFAKFWDIKESEVEKSIDTIIAHRIRKVDLGCIRYENAKGEKCHRYFLNCINIGLVATIMNLRNQTRHFFLGSRALSFLFTFILMIFQRMEYKMHLKINTDDIDRKVMTVCVGNARGYGQTPNAVPYNGTLDISVVYHAEMMQLIEGFYLLITNRILNHRSVHPYRSRKVEVLELGKSLVSVDGRLMKTPAGAFTIGVEQEVINFLFPA